MKNDAGTTGDDITYRFTFSKTNEDSTTFFNIRLGKQNLKTTYIAEKSIAGGAFSTIVSAGIVPPPYIGPRSITGAAGLAAAQATRKKLAWCARHTRGSEQLLPASPSPWKSSTRCTGLDGASPSVRLGRN